MVKNLINYQKAMKKLLLILLGTLIAVHALANDFEYTYEGQTLTYTVIDKNAKTCRTSSGNYPNAGNDVSGELTIPSIAKDGNVEYAVIEIGDWSFYKCSGLTGNLILPEGLTSIGWGAFRGCSGLTGNLTLPEGVASIGLHAFCDCSGLTGNLIFPKGVASIGDYAFWNCIGLTGNLILQEGIASIGWGAFYGCSGLNGNLILPEGLTSIGIGAFSGCSGLTCVEIPTTSTTIGEKAFWNCNALTQVYYGSDEPIKGLYNIFDDSTYERATLYMSETGAEKGRTIDPWKNFANIEVYEFDGIELIDADIDFNQTCEVYSLSGAKVGNTTENLAPGIYIVRQGNTVKKIAVKKI